MPESVLISASIIMKDEKANLPRCLASLKEAVDEIVVYDTGSSDGSIEIAESMGARVIRGYWDDDFARARNEALSACNGTWIISIDADEVFEGNIENFRSMLEANTSPGMLVEMVNVGKKENQNLKHRPFRLFQRKLWKWTGRLHEQLTPKDQPVQPTGIAPGILMLHYGYLAEAMTSKNKVERNLRIAELDAKSNNGRDECDKLTNLGRSLMIAGRMEDAHAALCKARDTPTDSLVVKRMALRSGTLVCLELNKLDEALEWVNDLEKISEHKDTCRHFRGLIYAAKGEWGLCLENVEGLDQIIDDDGIVLPIWTGHFRRAQAYAVFDRWEESADMVTRLATADSHDEPIWALFAESYWRTERNVDDVITKIPTKHMPAIFAQLASAPAQAADNMLESLWKFEDRRGSVLALAIRSAPHLSIERALEWDVRLHEVNLGERSPLLRIAEDSSRSAVDRIRASVVAYALFADLRVENSLLEAAAIVAESQFKALVFEIREMTPSLLESFSLAASHTAQRSFSMAQALHSIDATDKAIAILQNAMTDETDSELLAKAKQWLESIGKPS